MFYKICKLKNKLLFYASSFNNNVLMIVSNFLKFLIISDVSRKTKRKDGRPKMMLHLFFVIIHATQILLPLAIGFLLLFSPCKTPFLGSVLIPPSQCQSLSFLRFAIFLFEVIQMTTSVCMISFNIVYILMVGILFLWEQSDCYCHKSKSIYSYRNLQVMERPEFLCSNQDISHDC